jgi:hypothetical protein
MEELEMEDPPLPGIQLPMMEEEVEQSATLLIDTRNGFNELSQKAALWTVRHHWANGAQFTFNCYRHGIQLISRCQGKPCHILLS